MAPVSLKTEYRSQCVYVRDFDDHLPAIYVTKKQKASAAMATVNLYTFVVKVYKWRTG